MISILAPLPTSILGCREFYITEIYITETAITEFDITDTAIMESDITRKGKLLQRRPRIRAMLNSSARLFVQN